jgi:hypothetical protein
MWWRRSKTVDDLNLYVNFVNPLRIEAAPPPPPIRCMVTTTYDRFTVSAIAGDNHMAYTLPSDMQIKVQVTYLDAKGHPAKVDGDVEWTTSNEMIANVGVLNTDSTQAMVAPGKDLGQAQITAKADANVGEGVTEVVCTFDVEVVAGEAVIGTITPVGQPEPVKEVNPLKKK